MKRPNFQSEKRSSHHLEVQIHSSDIQKGVRYLFLSRRQVVGWSAAAVVFAIFLGAGLALAPNVIGSYLKRSEFAGLEKTREHLGDRLVALEGRLQRMKLRGDQLHLRMNKIYLAYGLQNDTSIGQGGYPVETSPERTRLAAGTLYEEEINLTNEVEAQVRQQVQVLSAFLKEIQSFEDVHAGQVTSTPSTSPLRGDFLLTSPYGTRRSPFTKKVDFHAGIDLASREGLAIYAPADGRVSFAGRYPLKQSASWWRYGNMVSLRHGDRFITLYGHLEDVSVKTGQRVQQGDLLGTVGNTGWSTNPHLHYEVRRQDDEGQFRPVDPRIYMLDHRWKDEEQLLVRARSAPNSDFEPLPRLIER